MKKIMKNTAVILMAATMMVGTATNVMAGQWQKNAKGWWWQEDNGSYPTSQWQWLDGNKDGIAECYFFDSNGYMLSGTTTPDGYTVNADGAWTEGGAVKTKNVTVAVNETNTTNTTNTTNGEAPATDIYSGTYAYSLGGLDFSMKITYDPATKTLIDTEWLPGFGQVTDKYHYAGINEMGYTVFECKRSNRTAISGDSYIYFSGPGVMAIETEDGYENLKKQ